MPQLTAETHAMHGLLARALVALNGAADTIRALDMSRYAASLDAIVRDLTDEAAAILNARAAGKEAA
jgi:hypothetical protein